MSIIRKTFATLILVVSLSLSTNVKASTQAIPPFTQYKELSSQGFKGPTTPEEWTRRTLEHQQEERAKTERTANELKFTVLGGIVLLTLLGKAFRSKKA